MSAFDALTPRIHALDQPPAISVVMHDVAPSTWAACQRALAALDEVHAAPVSLLIVADYHRLQRIEDDPAFLRAMEQRRERGDELIVHGLAHLDESSPAGGLRDRLLRRFYTAGEGEFYALSQSDAAQRLHQANTRFRGLGWQPQGFVAPAWLLGAGARAALREGPFAYTSSRRELILLPSGQRLCAPSLVWSVRAAWRRRMSAWWNERLLQRILAEPARYPLVRLGLHPADAAHPECLSFWQSALARALEAGRVPMTKGAWLTRRAESLRGVR